MRFVDDEALVLEVGELGDRDRLVVFLSRHHGLQRGAAQGARRRYSRFAGQLQPLAKVQVSWLEKAERELVRVRAVELVRPAHRLQQDLEGLLLGFYLAEHARVFAPPDEPNEVLFRLLDSTLEALLAGVDRSLACRFYEAWVLRASGIFPPPRQCPRCGGELAEGALLPRGEEGLVCLRCAGGGAGVRLAAETVSFLLRIGREGLVELAADPPPPAVLQQVEEVCREVRRGFLQHELASYGVMERVLAGAPDPRPA